MGTRKQYADLDFRNVNRVTNLPVPTDPDEAATKDYVDSLSGLIWQGTWNSGTAYIVNDLVYRNGSTYVSILGGTNHAPESSPTYWELVAQKGADGTNGSNVLSGIGVPDNSLGVNGDTYINVDNGDTYYKVSGSWGFNGSIQGPQGPTGDLVDRATQGVTSSSIANGVSWQGTIPLTKGYRLLRVSSSYPAWIRIYGNAAKQAADASRPFDTDPSGDHGVIFEFVTTASLLEAYLSPLVDGANFESPPNTTIPITITNRSGVTHAIYVEFDIQVTE